MKNTVACAVVATLLSLSACGLGGSDDEEASKAIAAEIRSSQESGGDDLFVANQEQADCIGDAMVDNVGTDDLKEYGVLTDDLKVDKAPTEVKMSAEDAEGAADAMFDCVDMQAMMLKAMASQQGDLEPAAEKCLEDALSEDALRDMFVQMFQGKEEAATEALTGPMMKCMMGSAPTE